MSTLSEGIKLIKSGDKAQGKSLLAGLVKADPDNEIAWLWLAVAVDDSRQKRQCLRQVLRINPDNSIARQGLTKLVVEMPTLDEIVPVSRRPNPVPKLQTPPLRNEKVDNVDQTTEILRLYLKIFLFVAIPFGLMIGLFLGVVQPLYRAIILSSIPMPKDTIFSSPPEPIFVSFISMLPESLWSGLATGLMGGVFFGSLISLMTGTWHIVAVRQMPFGKQPGALKTHHTRNIELNLPYDKVFDLCMEAILVKGGNIHLENREQGKILARTAMSMKTLGNKVTFEIATLGDGMTRVNISSKPSTDYIPVADLGRGLENIENIVTFLRLKEQEVFSRS